MYSALLLLGKQPTLHPHASRGYSVLDLGATDAYQNLKKKARNHIVWLVQPLVEVNDTS